jgi:hypothetical protein
MRTRCGQVVLIALALAVLLTGCATTTARQDTLGMPNAQNPEYLANPIRVIAAPLTVVGYALQFLVVEPIAFALNSAPDAFGLSLEEQRYLQERQAAWEKTLTTKQ